MGVEPASVQLLQVISRYDAVVAEAQTMRRLGGRTARVREAVHEAVIGLLSERSAEELSIAAVAERSGVHQATIYRRWRSMSVMLDDVVAEHLAHAAPVPDTGSLRGDLDAYAAGVAEGLAGPFRVLILRAVVDMRPGDPSALSNAISGRERQLQAMLDRSRARGEGAPTVEELMELVVAPLYFSALFSRPRAGEARRLVDRLLAVSGEA